MAEFLVVKLSPGPTKDNMKLVNKHLETYQVSSNIEELNHFMHSAREPTEIQLNKRPSSESMTKLATEEAGDMKRLATEHDIAFQLQSIGTNLFTFQGTSSLLQNKTVEGDLNFNFSLLQRKPRLLNASDLLLDEPRDGENSLLSEKVVREDVDEDGDQKSGTGEDIVKEENTTESFGGSEDRDEVGAKDSVEKHQSVPDLPSPPKTAFASGFECNVCVFAAPTFALLQRHHERDHPICNECGIRFRTLKALSAHKPLHRICDICGKSNFRSTIEFSRHKMIHTEEKNYECDICQKNFKLKWRLNDHMRTHTGERPYQCLFCHKSFSLSSTLNGHCRRIHGQ